MLEILIPPLLALEVSELLLKLKGKIEELVLDAVTIVDMHIIIISFLPR